MLGECNLLVQFGYRESRSFSVRGRYGGPFSHDALFFEAAPVGGPRAFGSVSCGLSVWTFDQLEHGEVGAFQPRL